MSYLGNLSGAMGGGPAAPGASQSTTPAISAEVVTWEITVTATPAPLATAWAANTAYLKGQAVVANGHFFVCTVGGTSALSGNGPNVSGAVVDGGAHWQGYPGVVFPGGLNLQNLDATNPVSFGDSAAQFGTVPPSYGSAPVNVSDPTAVWVSAAAGSPVLAIEGYP